MRAISKRFGTTRALSDVHFLVRPGTVHALLGENGAGKSTLMNIAHGRLRADAGQTFLHGAPAPGDGRPRARVGMVHQHLSLVPSMTATENFELGATGVLRLEEARRRLRALGDSSGLRVPLDVPVRELGLVEQQRIEILKALGRDSSLLIMDEPTAVLAPEESRELLAWLRRFAASGGSVVLVTHKLREAIGAADDITVLRRGEVAWTGASAEASETTLARAIFPDAAADTRTTDAARQGEPVVRAANLRLATARGGVAIANATFTLSRGEIVGIAAVEGSGHRELLSALAGLTLPSGGTLELPSEISYIPADRTREAIIPEFTLTENVALRQLGARRGMMPWASLRREAAGMLDRYSIVAESVDARAASLSGGNQQRLVVARELEHQVRLLVADNPARGLDLQATAFVHDQLRVAARDAAVVVHASDLDDVLAIATRVLVVFNGTVGEVPLDREAIGRAMLGAA